MNINSQFEFLAQSLRVQLEQIFKYPELVELDELEAISNVEIAVKSVLDAFHNIYDKINTLSNKTINFYDYPALHLIIAIRNAKHHNDPMKSILFENSQAIYVNFNSKEESFPCLIYPVSWLDISNKLKSNNKSLSKYPDIRNFLHADEFENKAKLNGFNVNDIYINIIPLMLQAGKKLIEICGDYINELDSTESKFFRHHFQALADDFQTEIISPYDKHQYAKDIRNMIRVTHEINNSVLAQPNPYLEEITPKSLI